MDCNPYFGATGERGDSGHKRRQSILWAEVDIFGGPGVMTADQFERFQRGCRWFGAAVHGWWGEDPVFERH